MSTLRLPTSLQADRYRTSDFIERGKVVIEIPDDYLTDVKSENNLSEVVCIQRLIALGNEASEVRVIWDNGIAKQALRSPSIFPLLSVVLCLDNATHLSIDGEILNVNVARRDIYAYKMRADLFSDVQILLCADNRGHGRPSTLYDSDGLVSREDFESIIDTLLSTHTGYGISNSKAVFFIKAISTIVAELFENTEIHGRLGLDNKPVEKNGLRGIIFKRIKVVHSGDWVKHAELTAALPKATGRKEVKESDALEISVFDSGIGFFSSYTRQKLEQKTPLSEEWDVVHRCLERHYDQEEYGSRPAHRAMGLYEVLRALKMVNGILEVRSGRTYGYRTFLPGELSFQLESTSSVMRPSMPKPVLLDHERKYVTIPTAHEKLPGSTLRVVIPLI